MVLYDLPVLVLDVSFDSTFSAQRYIQITPTPKARHDVAHSVESLSHSATSIAEITVFVNLNRSNSECSAYSPCSTMRTSTRL